MAIGILGPVVVALVVLLLLLPGGGSTAAGRSARARTTPSSVGGPRSSTAPTRATAVRSPQGSGAPAPTTSTTQPAGSPLGPAVSTFVAGRQGTTTAAVYDLGTGSEWQLDPGTAEATASIVKVDIMASLLSQLSATGQQLTADDRSLLTSMIEASDNDAATTLWNQIGGAPALAAFDQAIGMTDTVPSSCLTCPGFDWPGWGLTTTTPADQLVLLRHLVTTNDSIDDAYRATALDLLENVDPSERWGVTSGVPSGVTVALKNGWVPLQSGLWQIDSIGWVDGDGRDYLIAVLSSGNPSEQYGIDTVQQVAADVWGSLG